MMKTIVSILTVVGLIALGGVQTAFASDQSVPTLTITPTTSATQGETATIAVQLLDPEGKPIAGETVRLLAGAKFFGYSDNLEIGSATTDFQGHARFRYMPTVDGSRHLIAKYAGNGRWAAASVQVPWQVEPGDLPAAHSEPHESWQPPGGSQLWVLAALIAVWSAFGYAVFQIASIARSA